MADFHVIIVGGGLGGLTLAHGLKKHGVSCAVYEKDVSRRDRLQGYRISLRKFGTVALKSCLPEDLYSLIADTAAISRSSPQISLLTEQLDVLLKVELLAPENTDVFAVSRIVLHRILSMQLDHTVHFDHRYDHTDILPSGRLRVHFTNGEVAEGDLLVAADGIHSTVRREFLPQSFEPVKVGTVGVVGKVFCDEDSSIEGDEIDRNVAVIFGTQGSGAFIGPQKYSAAAKEKISELFAGVEGVPFEEQLNPNATGEELRLLGVEQKTALIDDARDYSLLAYITSHSDQLGFESEESRFGESQQGLLDAVVREMTEQKWSPKLIDLASKMDVNSIGYWPLHISPSVPTLKGHKPVNVTFLGDAIHAMPPTGGEGGNSALRDAAQLTRTLVKVVASQDPRESLDEEITAYEDEMLKFSSATVNRSMRYCGMMTAEGRFYPYLVRMGLRIVNFLFWMGLGIVNSFSELKRRWV